MRISRLFPLVLAGLGLSGCSLWAPPRLVEVAAVSLPDTRFALDAADEGASALLSADAVATPDRGRMPIEAVSLTLEARAAQEVSTPLHVRVCLLTRQDAYFLFDAHLTASAGGIRYISGIVPISDEATAAIAAAPVTLCCQAGAGRAAADIQLSHAVLHLYRRQGRT